MIRILGISLLIGVPLSGKWELSGGLELIFSALNDFHEFKLGSNTPKISAQLGYIFAPIGNPKNIVLSSQELYNSDSINKINTSDIISAIERFS